MKKPVSLLLAIMMFLTVAVPLNVAAVSVPVNIVNEKDTLYSYEDMEKDLKLLQKYYPDRVTLKVLEKTADKRNIYCMILGNPKAKKKILVHGSIHAREYMNTQILMESMERYVRQYAKGKYKNMKYSALFHKVAVYMVPMVNPDGVTISQYGIVKIKNSDLRNHLKKMKKYGGGYSRWKANAQGVDLNRNFPKDWGKGNLTSRPSSERYGGKKPISENESKALVRLVKNLSGLQACISYHSQGRLLYWDFGQKGKVRNKTYSFMKMLQSVTGYKPVTEYSAYKGCGEFGHYANVIRKVPNITVETGTGNAPVPRNQFRTIYNQNKTVIERTAYMFQ